jgi:hypothetical protein
MGFSHAVVAANESGDGHRFRCRERRAPTRPVLHRARRFAPLVDELPGLLPAKQRFACHRMLAFREPRELLFVHFAFEAPALGKLALPLAPHTLAFRVIVLLRVRELGPVIGLRLAR